MMASAALALLVSLAGAAATALQAASQALPTVDCVEWRRCRELALAAADRGEYETFHDLAWRAVQTGPPKDPSLMYLLARAQSLSGRPHDALVMLQRLAEMGVASDAATNDDFRRARQHRSWPEVEALLAAVAASGVPPPAAAPATAVPAPAVSTLGAVPEAARFSTTRFAVGGLAYDARSRRFVLGDRLGRKLLVVDEQSDHTSDLVRADSAGFLDITAVEIDTRRGDLWVASTAPEDGTSALHRLQLVSGRPLRTFPVDRELGYAQVVDLALGRDGTVLVLDAATPQVLVLRPGRTALERLMRIDAPQPVSVTARGDGVAFVAHRDGVSRIDVESRTVTAVASPKDNPLDRLERIRWQGNGLIAIQADAAGARRILRLDMNARGTAFTRATRLEISAEAAGLRFVTISGDDLVYLAPGSPRDGGRSSLGTDQEELVAYRVRIR
jgi:hypothetical protein